MITDSLRCVLYLVLVPALLSAQVQSDPLKVKNWQAPMYWQPAPSESAIAKLSAPRTFAASDPEGALVFVAMTPCRVADTRSGSGFTGAFGPPSLAGGAIRTFPIQSSTNCSIPPVAEAYSFNVTLVPNGFVDYVTLWPTGQLQPNASTINGYVNTVVANAAIVPAGLSGSVDVYASQSTNLIIDINGYYAPQSGLTLAQGNSDSPSLSFSGDPGTGIFSSGPGSVNIATGGSSRLNVGPNGDVNVTGNANVAGILSASAVGINTSSPQSGLHVHSPGNVAPITITTGSGTEGNSSFRLQADSGLTGMGRSFVIFDNAAAQYRMIINGSGNVGFGSAPSTSRLELSGQDGLGITGFQPFLTLRDSNAGNARSVIQGFSGGLTFFPHSFLGGNAAMYLQNGTGNLGLGSTSPTAKFQVESNGSGLAAPTVRANNTNSAGIGIWSTTNSIDSNVVISNNGSGDLIRGFCAGCGAPAFRVLNNGTTVTRVLQITGGSDLAEHFEVEEGIQPGMVVAIDQHKAGKLTIARGAYNRRAAGVISGANNLSAGMVLPEPTGVENSMAVTLTGRVWVYCDATKKPVKAGDLLTTSDTPGHAMKVTNYNKAQGAIIGKALTSLQSGRGLVLVLASLQ